MFVLPPFFTVCSHRPPFEVLFCEILPALTCLTPSQPTGLPLKTAFGVKLKDVFTAESACASQRPAALCMVLPLLLVLLIASL